MRLFTLGLLLVATVPGLARADTPQLGEAQTLFYNARYVEAAAVSPDACRGEPVNLVACELRTSALLFQMRRALGDGRDRDKAFAQCEACPALLSTFVAEIRLAQLSARAALKAAPDDYETLFLLGKLDLNYVWLQLGTLGRKTGWGDYWEARKSLDRVLEVNPAHVRAKVARAWIDYIVDTKMPRGTRWLLGGGNKKRGLQAVLDAAAMPGEPFVRAEAMFALWDMQVRERRLPEARTTALALADVFPGNPELQKFLELPVPTVGP
jgi:tetratricopeptide (TPR) repeat protein